MVFDINGNAVGYSQSERAAALEVSLTALAQSLGYTPVRSGKHYSLKEMDSLIIYNDQSWNRWSGVGNITSGSQIDFLMEFAGITSVPQAIKYLLDFRGYNSLNNTKYNNHSAKNSSDNVDISNTDKNMILPPKNENYRRLYAYLMKTRGIDQEIVSEFVHRKLIYEDAEHHNIVFIGYDKNGEAKYAGMRGTADLYGHKFKCDVPGNDKNYGVNIVNKNSMEVLVFESVIDSMSFLDIYSRVYNTASNWPNIIVLGMVEDNPLVTFLNENLHIKSIRFCLDNDEAGHKALYGENNPDGTIKRIGLIEKYEKQGYRVNVSVPTYGKDFNETLLEMNKLQEQSNRMHRGR